MAKEELVGQVADQMDNVAEEIEVVAEATRRVSRRDMKFLVAGLGIGIPIGIGIGYLGMEKRIEKKYKTYVDDELSELKEHYKQKVVAAQEKPAPAVVVEEARYSEKELQAIEEANAKFPPEETAVVEEVVAEEVVVEEPRLVTPDEEWDYAVETKNRDPLVPYIIHTDEFNENPSEHVQVTYTYYEMDDVLAGDRDEVIEDMDTQIGLGNLGHWGHGSGDPNIVYIRNEYMQIDAEVCRDPGSYVEQTRRNIRHSQNYRQRKPNRKFDDE